MKSESYRILMLATLIIVVGFCAAGEVCSQRSEEKGRRESSSAELRENIEAVLGSQDLTNSLLAEDWEAVFSILTQDSAYARDGRVWLLIGHAHLARNSNNVAYAVFSTILDSSSRYAWETWTAGFASTHPRSHIAHYLYGDALARNQKPDEAINEFAIALNIDSTFCLAANGR